MTLSRRALFALDLPRLRRSAGCLLRVHRTAMACRVEVALPEGDSQHLAAAKEALNEADRVEALLTVFRESSELSRVNREGADGAASVDAELFDLLTRCQDIHAQTGGAFDITSSPLSRCWGFLYREGRVPSHDEVEAARVLVGMAQVALDAPARTVRFARGGMELNLGAIGKGYALDRMADLLRAFGVRRALLSAGGSSVMAVGRDWPIDIRSPLVPQRLARVRLTDCALGTSGAGEQFVIADGARYGHVIDPRCGRPAAGVMSASVVASDAATADALSTAFFIGGVDLARRYCTDHPGILVLLTPDDGTAQPLMFGRHAGVVREE